MTSLYAITIYFLFFLVPEVNGWNISIPSIGSTSINVSWAYYAPADPHVLSFYAVVCTLTNHDAGPTVAIASETQLQLEVTRLRAVATYSVQVLAVTIHKISGAFSFKGSQKSTISTIEGGKYWP